jgi:hypothetical protein
VAEFIGPVLGLFCAKTGSINSGTLVPCFASPVFWANGKQLLGIAGVSYELNFRIAIETTDESKVFLLGYPRKRR